MSVDVAQLSQSLKKLNSTNASCWGFLKIIFTSEQKKSISVWWLSFFIVFILSIFILLYIFFIFIFVIWCTTIPPKHMCLKTDAFGDKMHITNIVSSPVVEIFGRRHIHWMLYVIFYVKFFIFFLIFGSRGSLTTDLGGPGTEV